jgi:hypothetical protein
VKKTPIEDEAKKTLEGQVMKTPVEGRIKKTDPSSHQEDAPWHQPRNCLTSAKIWSRVTEELEAKTDWLIVSLQSNSAQLSAYSVIASSSFCSHVTVSISESSTMSICLGNRSVKLSTYLCIVIRLRMHQVLPFAPWIPSTSHYCKFIHWFIHTKRIVN